MLVRLIALLFLTSCTVQGPAMSPLSGQIEVNMATTVETAFGSVAATYAEKLAERSYRVVDIVNDTDCDIQVRLDDSTGTPHTVVPDGTAETLDFGRIGGFVQTSVSLQYMSGETCSSGSVYLKGIY